MLINHHNKRIGLSRSRQNLPACVIALGGLLIMVNPAQADPNQLSSHVEQLAAEVHHDREAAMVALLSLGPEIRSEIEVALRQADDPEVRRRLRYVLEHVSPPQSGLIVLNTTKASVIRPGDIITHIDGRKVSSETNLNQIGIMQREVTLQLWSSSGPRTVRVTDLNHVRSTLNYERATGDQLAGMIRDYAQGFPERAAEQLESNPSLRRSQQLSQEFRIVLDFANGRRNTALQPILDDSNISRTWIRPSEQRQFNRPGTIWDLPAPIDLKSPIETPFQLEWELWQNAGPQASVFRSDPDVRVQRVLVPANRHLDALVSCAAIWWNNYQGRDLFTIPQSESINKAGNMLAVVSWMAWELDLLSECSRLIEPRSRVLRRLVRATNGPPIKKWLRVHTDAWLPYLQGDPKAALDMYYDEALRILEHPLQPNNPAVLTQNPAVAGVMAYFLYQFPTDERVQPTLKIVNHPHQSARLDYAWWMCLALRAGNYETIRTHLGQLTPNLPTQSVPRFARGMALLEYIADNPTPETFATASELVTQHAPIESRAALRAEVQTLRHLSADDLEAAAESIKAAADSTGGPVLKETIAFREWLGNAPLNTLSDRPPRLAVPADPNRDTWLIVTENRQMMRYDRVQDQLQPLTDVPGNWFPGVLTWPWIGFEESTGRTWAYAPRAVYELGNSDRPVRVSLETDQIAEFDRAVRPIFSTFAKALASGRVLDTRDGEYLIEDVSTQIAPIASPAWPEISELRVLPEDKRLTHLATRNGVHCLINKESATAWTNLDITESLRLEYLEWLMPVAARDANTPIAYLMTNVGLIELDTAKNTLARRTLPDLPEDTGVVAEYLPYERHDPRYVYFALGPENGGDLYRLNRESDEITKLQTQNFGYSRSFYRQRSRAWIRDEIDRRLEERGVPNLAEFTRIADRETKPLDVDQNP